MALPFSNTAGRTLERLRNAFIETARGAREVVGAPLRPDLPDDDIRGSKPHRRLPRRQGRGDGAARPRGGTRSGVPLALARRPQEIPADPGARLRAAARGGVGRGRALADHQGAAAHVDEDARAARRAAAARVRRRAAGREVRRRPACRAAGARPRRCRGADPERGSAAAARRLVRRRLPRPGAHRLARAGGAAREARRLRGGARDPLAGATSRTGSIPTGAASPSSIRGCRTSR